MLDQITYITEIGGWEMSLDDLKPIWTEKTRQIHEVDEDFEPDLDSAISFYPNRVQKKLRSAIDDTIATGNRLPADL